MHTWFSSKESVREFRPLTSEYNQPTNLLAQFFNLSGLAKDTRDVATQTDPELRFNGIMRERAPTLVGISPNLPSVAGSESASILTSPMSTMPDLTMLADLMEQDVSSPKHSL